MERREKFCLCRNVGGARRFLSREDLYRTGSTIALVIHSVDRYSLT